jgi:hypothetical protein
MNPDPNKTPPDTALQFDKAEFKQAATLQCAVCKAPIAGEFYQINGQTVCPSCRQRAESELGGGSSATRFAMATGAGIVAAAGGVVLHWAVRLFVGGIWGLTTIAAAWMVGYAVRWGSRAKGGLPYQLLSVFLTYCSFAASQAHYFLPRDRGQNDFLDYLTAFQQAAALPFTSGRAIFLWIIIAIALQQAWQMNRGMKLQISGPFLAGQPSPPAAT